jgi:hypothetical protein
MRTALLCLALLSAAPATRADGPAPGEEAVFAVSYLGIPTGEARLRVGRPEGDVWPVILQARTGGVASLLDIREHLVSYWDAPRQLSRGSDLQAYEVGDVHADSARFDGTGRRVTVVEQRRGRPAKRKVLEVPEGALDLTGALFWLRHQELEPGQRHELPVVSGTSQFTLVAEVLGREEVKTAAGAFPCVKVQVRTAFQGKFSTRRDSFLWLAEGAGRTLVRASAEFAVGSVVLELTRYHPGGQLATAD